MICPICGREFLRPPAVSRRDNHTPICSRCGTREALENLGMDEDRIEGVLIAIYGDDVE